MALTNLGYSDNTYDIDIVYNGALTTAHVTHILTGIRARGNSRHNPEDDYDQVFGSDLAIVRAKERLYNKLVKKYSKGAF